MTHSIAEHHDDDHSAKDVFGFWIYILSDCILFAAIFATFAVLHNNIFAGPSLKALSNLPYIFVETCVLLVSSFTYGMAILNSYQNRTQNVFFWLGFTFLLGATFVGMEIKEFVNLYVEGHTWQSSAALSSFFTLVGTHGLHVSIGLFWMFIVMIQLKVFGLTPVMKKRLNYLGLFWAFLDIIWIFVFTIVYLMGAI